MEFTDADSAPFDQLVQYVEQRRMQPCAIFILEMIRPFSGSLSILSEAFLPMLKLCFGHRLSRNLHHLLGDRQKISLLIDRLEESAHIGGGCRGR